MRHDSWLYFKNSTFEVPSRVIILDGNKNLKEIENEILQRWNEIFP